VTTPSGTNGYSTEGGKNSDKHLIVTVTLVDDGGAPVEGATVTASINDPSGADVGGTGTTDASGQVTFRITNAPSGTYTTTVTEVLAAGFSWDGTTPANSFTK
jgi:protocatechuate 3,4-dioxygenase beta subunit